MPVMFPVCFTKINSGLFSSHCSSEHFGNSPLALADTAARNHFTETEENAESFLSSGRRIGILQILPPAEPFLLALQTRHCTLIIVWNYPHLSASILGNKASEIEIEE
jgi:hypothetical protein